jgi:hypothetical protein
MWRQELMRQTQRWLIKYNSTAWFYTTSFKSWHHGASMSYQVWEATST